MPSIKFCPDYSVVATEFKSCMAKKDMNQTELAKKMGCCQATIHNRLGHAAGFTLSELVRATGVLGVSITIEKGQIIIN